MPPRFEELDFQKTAVGELSLRRRLSPALDDAEVYEVKLDGAMLMSSAINSAEIALADIALAGLDGALDVVVGGLGLGYTAKAALDHVEVMRVDVIEHLAAVIDWHRRGLVPLGAELIADPRCHFIHGDFFELMTADASPHQSKSKYHAMLIDIDHSPACLLTPRHEPFYQIDRLRRMAARLHAGGSFALWSADPPEDGFMKRLAAVFAKVETGVIHFDNPMVGEADSNTIYVARKP